MAGPKRHAPALFDLAGAGAEALGLLVVRLARALRRSEGAEHVYSFVIGDRAPHVHSHVVPRYPGAPHGGEPEIAALAARLKTTCEQALAGPTAE